MRVTSWDCSFLSWCQHAVMVTVTICVRLTYVHLASLCQCKWACFSQSWRSHDQDHQNSSQAGYWTKYHCSVFSCVDMSLADARAKLKSLHPCLYKKTSKTTGEFGRSKRQRCHLMPLHWTINDKVPSSVLYQWPKSVLKGTRQGCRDSPLPLKQSESEHGKWKQDIYLMKGFVMARTVLMNHDGCRMMKDFKFFLSLKTT